MAIIRFFNPPVNTLSAQLRSELGRLLDHCEGDSSIEAVVLMGCGDFFSSGADIREMGSPAARQQPLVHELQDRLVRFPKTTVAALNGQALGGGLELALACQARIAVPSARLGLPEIRLGIIPGAGGTQMLPRIVGPEKALELLMSGESLSAAQALAIGLIDEVVDDLPARATALARTIAEPRSVPAGRAPVVATHELFADARRDVARSTPGFMAPLVVIDCVQVAMTEPLARGLEIEREALRTLRENAQHRALRHLFFAERAARKQGGISATCLPETLILVGADAPPRDGAALFTEGRAAGSVLHTLPVNSSREAVLALAYGAPGSGIIVSSAADLRLRDEPGVVVADALAWPGGGRLVLLIADRAGNHALAAGVLSHARATGAAAVVVPRSGALSRTWQAYQDAADALVAAGWSGGRIDAIVSEFGMAAGPFEMRSRLGSAASERIRDAARDAGYRKHPVSEDPDDPTKALFLPVVREAQHCLEAGLLRSIDDIDVIWTRGLGFPPYRGGPHYWFARSNG